MDIFQNINPVALGIEMIFCAGFCLFVHWVVENIKGPKK